MIKMKTNKQKLNKKTYQLKKPNKPRNKKPLAWESDHGLMIQKNIADIYRNMLHEI